MVACCMEWRNVQSARHSWDLAFMPPLQFFQARATLTQKSRNNKKIKLKNNTGRQLKLNIAENRRVSDFIIKTVAKMCSCLCFCFAVRSRCLYGREGNCDLRAGEAWARQEQKYRIKTLVVPHYLGVCKEENETKNNWFDINPTLQSTESFL